MEKEQLNMDLPEDIILRILCRLLIKSLIQLCCVSKRWRSIRLSDPQFGKAHLILAYEKRCISRKLIYLVSPYTSVHNLPYRAESLETLFGDNSSVTNLTFPSEAHCRRLLASCNGLVLLGDYYTEWSIWNPSTGFFRKINPAPEFSSIKKVSGSGPDDYGFGYVSSTDDYKLVLLRNSGSDDSIWFCGCQHLHILSESQLLEN